MKRVIGLYLAAGRSSRMGTDKLSLPAGGAQLGSFALLAAIRSRLELVIVVTGKQGEDGEEAPVYPSWMHPLFFEEPARRRWRLAACGNAGQGQALSLRCGLQAAAKHDPDAVMILLADQPGVTSAMLNRLLRAYDGSGAACAASSYSGLLRPPVIIGKERFDRIAGLSGDEGARRWIRDGGSTVEAVHFADSRLFEDADTMEEYVRIAGRLRFGEEGKEDGDAARG
ncbi:nucleotidyltransferase family protein [Cohnella caldifontis]|uniref:nucleotidyltransferase family protein n=1 Tax=Cohnella caldifontis TaxID=3027471 RepID=UPI0023EC47C2|nr:NTP transferase domain-containing protein [Cohnella sp. YIM B05605]